MTYADNLELESVVSQYLVVIKPRRAVTSWTVITGTKYSASFDYGQIISLKKDDTTETEASSSALSDGTWYYDYTSETLYVDFTSNPALFDVIVSYELYLGTFDAHWYRSPLDSSSRVVYYEPLISKSPVIASSTNDYLYGFIPTRSSSLVISNATHFFEKHIYDGSFNKADIDIYHYLDTLSVANLKRIYRGVGSNISYSNDSINFKLLDRSDVLTNEFRHSASVSFFSSGTWANLDPTYDKRPIRTVFGVVDGFIPVNIDYVEDSPTTSDNRDWVCISDETNSGSITATVPASPASTTTRTYVDDITGIRVGDSVWIDSSGGAGLDEFVRVTAIGANYFDHATITNAAASASIVRRSFVGSVNIYQNDVLYEALYGRDYLEYSDATNHVKGFSFQSTLESNLSMTNTLATTDVVYARVYGNTNTVTLGGGAFGSDSSVTGNLTSAVVILFSILKQAGLAESEIDTTTFSSLQSSITDEISMAVPETSSNDFPTYKDLISKILVSLLLKLYIDDDNKWTAVQTGPLGSDDKTIEDDEIIKNSFSYNFDYNEIVSTVFVDYAFREVNRNHEPTADTYNRVSSTSTLAQRLHGVSRQKSFVSLHFIESEAQTLCDRIKYAVGDRNGTCSIKTKNRFFATELNDTIGLTRTRLPGNAWDGATEFSRSFSVQSTFKSLREITIELNDQKGIEDNEGSW